MTDKIKTKAEKIAEMQAEIERLKNEPDALEKDVAHAIALTIQIDANRELYKKREEILDRLLDSGLKQFEHNGSILTLVDNFAKKNIKWKQTCFNQYSIELTQGVKK